MAGKFPPAFPAGCPKGGAEVEGDLYHGCESNPATPEDFTPHAMSSRPRKQAMAKTGGCIAWGLSVWVSEDDARHAQELFPLWAAKWHIFKGRVTAVDGQLAHTPTNQQSNHHTFWCYDGVDLLPRFVPALPPLRQGS